MSALQSACDKIAQDGFAVVERVVSPEEVAALKEQLELAMVEDMRQYGHLPGKKENLVLDLVSSGPAFVHLLENETMHRVFAHFLTNTCILYSFTSSILRPNDRPGAASIHVDSPRWIPGYELGLLMTLSLDDFTLENGATYYLPGSHHSDKVPPEEEFYRNAVTVCRRAGDAVFFSPRAFHAAGINKTSQVRHACTVYACRSFLRQRLDYPHMVGPEVLAELGERGRAFLGFNVRVPTNMYEFYAPEHEPYKANQG